MPIDEPTHVTNNLGECDLSDPRSILRGVYGENPDGSRIIGLAFHPIIPHTDLPTMMLTTKIETLEQFKANNSGNDDNDYDNSIVMSVQRLLLGTIKTIESYGISFHPPIESALGSLPVPEEQP